MIVTAPLKPDADGFTIQHCKNDVCGKYFKVDFRKGSESQETIAFCPYCKFQGQFWTLDQMHYLDCVARLQGPCTQPKEPDKPNNILPTTCKGPGKHSERIKHDGSAIKFCIICGNAV